MRVSPELTIPENEIELEFVHSSGPGGQNVNKVATAVQLRFDARNSPSLSEEVRERLIKLAGNRATSAGVIIIEAKSSRSQSRNRKLAFSQLRSLLQAAEQKPRKRIATKPSISANERRIQQKKQRGRKKKERRWSSDDNWS